jgi:hypothetical protein
LGGPGRPGSGGPGDGPPGREGAPGWPAGPRARWPRPAENPGWRSYPLLVAVVAVVAAAAGAALVLLIANAPAVSPSAAGSQPSTAPTQGAGGGIPGSGGPGGPAGSGAGHLQALIVGKVTAVSSTSITLAGQGNSITAAITHATKVSGKATSISGVKVGDQVLAQLTGTGGTFTATTIQDPASIS